MNDKGIYKQFGAKKYHGNPIPDQFIANDEQRKQKADVEKRKKVIK